MRWLIAGLVLGLAGAGVAVLGWQAAERARHRAEIALRAYQEERARAEGLAVVSRQSERQIRAVLAERQALERDLEDLRRRLAEASDAPVEEMRDRDVMDVWSAPVTVTMPCEPLEPGAASESAPPPRSVPHTPGLLRLRLLAGTVETAAGAAVFTGRFQIWTDPEPRRLLGEAPVSVDLSRWWRAPAPVWRPSTREAWLAALASSDGVGLAGGVLWPEARIFGVRARPLVGAFALPGEVGVMAGAAWRW